MTRYLLIATLAFGTIACTRSQQAEVRDEAAEARARADKKMDDWEAERREYSRKMEDRLSRLDREIDEARADAKANSKKMSAKARREYNERIAELESLKKETREKWNDAKAETKDEWNDFKRSMDEAGDKLDNAWERFKADMKS